MATHTEDKSAMNVDGSLAIGFFKQLTPASPTGGFGTLPLEFKRWRNKMDTQALCAPQTDGTITQLTLYATHCTQ